MQLRGIVQNATLKEQGTDPDAIEMVLSVQGVGAGQPRKLVVPYAMLLEDESLDPDAIAGRGFDAEVEPEPNGRWVVTRINFASRVLRRPE